MIYNVYMPPMMIAHETNIMSPLDILYDRRYLYIIKPPSNGSNELLIRCQIDLANKEGCGFLLTQLLNGVEWPHRVGVYH